MIDILAVTLAVAAGVSAALWGVSARLRRGAWRHSANLGEDDAQILARTAFFQHLHASLLYLACAVMGLAMLLPEPWSVVTSMVLLVPVGITFALARNAKRDTHLFLDRLAVVRKAEEAMAQQGSIAHKWAASLVPTELQAIDNVEIASKSQSASGVVTGDFLDVIPLSSHRFALVLGDAAGHGVEASIPAFQAKYVLRTVVHQYRDPAQALEVLNEHISNLAPDEGLMSLILAVIDTRHNTLRYASAGHCTCWATSEGEPVALRSTGPLLMLDPAAEYASREIPFTRGQIAVLYSDGVIEAKRGNSRLGEEKVVNLLRREQNSSIEVICKSVLNSASRYSDGTKADDITVLGVRRT